MSYLQLYVYRIRKADQGKFLDIMRKVREIYRKYGAYGEELFVLHNKASKYGVTGLWELLPTAEDEELWISLDRYQNPEQCAKVTKKVDADPEIDPLYERTIELVSSASRIVRGEFGMVTY